MASIRTGNVLHSGTSIRLGKEIDNLQELLAIYQFEATICLDMVISLLITKLQ